LQFSALSVFLRVSVVEELEGHRIVIAEN